MKIAAVAVILVLAGCSQKIEVQSNTSWSGHVNGGSVVGSGNRTYELREVPTCWTFQKDGEVGYLRVKQRGRTGDEPSTTAPYGVVSGCTQ